MRAKPAQKMVNRSDRRCRVEETSLDGAAGSSATMTAPGAPAVLVSFSKVFASKTLVSFESG